MLIYLFICPFFIPAFIQNEVLRTQSLTLGNTSNNINNKNSSVFFYFFIGIWNGFTRELNIYRTIGQYISCNRLKYLLVLCSVIIVSQTYYVFIVI